MFNDRMYFSNGNVSVTPLINEYQVTIIDENGQKETKVIFAYSARDVIDITKLNLKLRQKIISVEPYLKIINGQEMVKNLANIDGLIKNGLANKKSVTQRLSDWLNSNSEIFNHLLIFVLSFLFTIVFGSFILIIVSLISQLLGAQLVI